MKGYTRLARKWFGVVLVGVLAICGCQADDDGDGGGGGGGGGGGNNDTFNNATPAALENQTFTFIDGRAFAPGLTNATTALIIGDFDNDGDNNPATGPYTLEATNGTATGTLTVASCTLRIMTTTFSAGTFPELQANRVVSLNPCRVGSNTGRLEVVNAATGATSLSSNPTDFPTRGVAFVLTTDFQTGSYSVVELASRRVLRDIAPGKIHSDAIARAFGGRIYVVNRLGADNIQVIDPQQGYTTPAGAQLSVGNGTNPQDIAFVNATKAYVSLLDSDRLHIINPTTLTLTGQVDLSRFTRPGDSDRVPEVTSLLMHDGLLYVTLQHIDFNTSFPFTKVAPGQVIIINPITDTVRGEASLNGRNPVSFLQFSPALRRILVSTVGDFGVNDGGIESLDPVTGTVDAGFRLTEGAAGGDITHFQIVSSEKGYAIVSDSNFANSLISFNPSTGQRLNTLAGPLNVFIPQFSINSLGELYLAITDTATGTPGVRIFDTNRDREITTTPLNVGTLPPQFVLFIE